jgi:hypothetical protein
MSALIEGNFMAKPVAVELGNNKKNQAELRVEFEIAEGPHAGRKVSYSGLFNEKSTKYTKAAMVALGWQGKDARTITTDAMASPKPVPVEVQIVRWENPDTGKVSEWSAVRNVGRFREALKPLAANDAKDVNNWLNEAGDVSGSSGGDNKEIPF